MPTSQMATGMNSIAAELISSVTAKPGQEDLTLHSPHSVNPSISIDEVSGGGREGYGSPSAGPLDPDIFAIKVEKLRLMEERIRQMKNDSLPFYRPHEKQAIFHSAGARFKYRMVRAGNRFGKSLMGCAEDCAWVRGERPWLAKDDPLRRGGIPQRPVKLLTITTDWDKSDEIFTSQRGEGGKIWRFLPRDGFVKDHGVRRNHSGAIDTVEFSNGSLWRFDTVRSWLANPQGSESSDWDAIHVDEPCPEQMWKAVSRGLIDRNGSAWFTLTPLSEFWINDFFFPQDTGGRPRDNVFAVSGSTYDNPYLSPEAIREYEATLTEEEKACRLHGIPLHLSGLVYKQFAWDRHVLVEPPLGWKGFTDPPLSLPVYYAIDPHPKVPHAVLFCTVLQDGRRVYFYDMFVQDSVEEVSRSILNVVRGRNVVSARIDPIAATPDPITKCSSLLEEFWKNGVFVGKATKAREAGTMRVQSELKKDQILFAPTCVRTLWEIQRYAWDPETNKPVDENDHMMENLYRIELDDPVYVERSGSQAAVEEESIVKAEFNLKDLEEAVPF